MLLIEFPAELLVLFGGENFDISGPKVVTSGQFQNTVNFFWKERNVRNLAKAVNGLPRKIGGGQHGGGALVANGK